MQLHITQVQLYQTKKDGTPLIDKTGKPYSRAVIKTTEHGDQFLSGFVYNPLKVGDAIEADIKEEEYMGKTQLKFHIQSAKKLEMDKIMNALVHIDRNVTAILQRMQMKDAPEETKGIAYPQSTGPTAFDEPTVEDSSELESLESVFNTM